MHRDPCAPPRPRLAFRLGEWRVHPDLDRLERDGRIVHVRPKLMDLLVFLVDQVTRVVPTEEILESVWAREFLAESVLTRTMAELRVVLGDDSHEPRYIQTIAKRGYRIVAAVERATDPPAPPRPDARCEVVVGERVIPLPPGEHVIGRGEEVAVDLSSPKASRRHARIVVTERGAVLEDLGSKNGTYLRGRRVTAPTPLVSGDEVSIGREVLRIRLTTDAASTEADD